MQINKTLYVNGEEAQLRLKWDWKNLYHINTEVWIDGVQTEAGSILVDELLTFAEVLRSAVDVAEKTDKEIRKHG